MNVFCGMMGTGISRKALDVFIYIFIYVCCHFKYHHHGCQIDCEKRKDIVISVDAFGTKSGYQALVILSVSYFLGSVFVERKHPSGSDDIVLESQLTKGQ